MGKQYDWLKQKLDEWKHTSPPFDCVDWPFSVTSERGVGQLSVHGQRRVTNRLVFEMWHGYLPPYVAITCGNKRCINPLHLAPADTMREVMKLNQRNRKRKISDKQALEIIQLIRKKELPHKEIAARYNIGTSTVSNINCGDAFAYLSGASRENPIARQGSRVNVTDEIRAQVFELRKAGMLQREVGEMLGIHFSTVSRIERGLR